MKKYIAIVWACFLSGCGGNSDDSSPSTITNQSASGIWKGTGTNSLDNTSGEIAGLIASNGKSFFVTDYPSLIYGNTSVSGNNFSFNGMGYDGASPYTVSMSGTVTSGTSIDIDYSTPDETGTISLLKADSSIGVYERASSLEKLAGTWNDSISDTTGTWVFTIQNNGNFSGIRVTDNCSMSGEFSIIDSSKNEYQVIATVSSCNEFNGVYSGLGFTSDANTFVDNVINFAIANNQNAGIFELTKQ